MKVKPNEISKRFGLKVKIERIKRNWTQEQLEEYAGISRAAISAIERGASSPTLETVALLADAFGLGLTDIVNLDYL